MSSASIDAVADSGGSRMTNVARTVAIVLLGMPPGNLLHLTSVMSAAGNWVSGSQIRKCPGDK